MSRYLIADAGSKVSLLVHVLKAGVQAGRPVDIAAVALHRAAAEHPGNCHAQTSPTNSTATAGDAAAMCTQIVSLMRSRAAARAPSLT